MRANEQSLRRALHRAREVGQTAAICREWRLRAVPPSGPLWRAAFPAPPPELLRALVETDDDDAAFAFALAEGAHILSTDEPGGRRRKRAAEEFSASFQAATKSIRQTEKRIADFRAGLPDLSTVDSREDMDFPTALSWHEEVAEDSFDSFDSFWHRCLSAIGGISPLFPSQAGSEVWRSPVLSTPVLRSVAIALRTFSDQPPPPQTDSKPSKDGGAPVKSPLQKRLARRARPGHWVRGVREERVDGAPGSVDCLVFERSDEGFAIRVTVPQGWPTPSGEPKDAVQGWQIVETLLLLLQLRSGERRHCVVTVRDLVVAVGALRDERAAEAGDNNGAGDVAAPDHEVLALGPEIESATPETSEPDLAAGEPAPADPADVQAPKKKKRAPRGPEETWKLIESCLTLIQKVGVCVRPGANAPRVGTSRLTWGPRNERGLFPHTPLLELRRETSPRDSRLDVTVGLSPSPLLELHRDLDGVAWPALLSGATFMADPGARTFIAEPLKEGSVLTAPKSRSRMRQCVWQWFALHLPPSGRYLTVGKLLREAGLSTLNWKPPKRDDHLRPLLTHAATVHGFVAHMNADVWGGSSSVPSEELADGEPLVLTIGHSHKGEQRRWRESYIRFTPSPSAPIA